MLPPIPDRITHWIENLPDPSEASPRRSGRKRCWDEMNDDSMQQTPERQARILTPSTSAGDPDNNAETTPRPPRSAFTTLASVPDLRPSPSASSASSIRSSATRSATGSSQSRGVKRRKSESPKRLLENLSLARCSVETQGIRTVGGLPEGVRKLAESLRRCEIRVGILHEDSRAVMEPYLNAADVGIFSDERAGVGSAPPHAEIVDLVETANEMEDEWDGEAAWNCGVHYPFLRLALRHSTWRKELRCHNVTIASIQSDAFDHPGYGEGVEGPNSRIDFSIGLRLSHSDKMGFFRSTSSANPTLHAPTRFVPTAVHIETKLTGEGMREAQSQLFSWLARHVAKLRELLTLAGHPSDAPIPILPLLIVQGHDWKCLFFEDRVSDARVHTSYSVGSTMNEVGAYAVVAALQYLMDWSQNEYRPWFEKMILQPLLTKAP